MREARQSSIRIRSRIMGTSRRQKIGLSLGLLALDLIVVGAGALATFTSSAVGAQSVSSGIVSVVLGTVGSSTNRLNVAAAGVVPGDTIQRTADLIDAGDQDLGSITMTAIASPTSLLDTDVTDGLQMTIDRCSVPWTEGGIAPAYTYTCAGTTTLVLGLRPVIGSNLSLSNLTSTTAGNTDHLRLTLSLPALAGNLFQGNTSTIAYTFTGIQRAGTNK
jgi:spore coat-associated protein N